MISSGVSLEDNRVATPALHSQQHLQPRGYDGWSAIVKAAADGPVNRAGSEASLASTEATTSSAAQLGASTPSSCSALSTAGIRSPLAAGTRTPISSRAKPFVPGGFVAWQNNIITVPILSEARVVVNCGYPGSAPAVVGCPLGGNAPGGDFGDSPRGDDYFDEDFQERLYLGLLNRDTEGNEARSSSAPRRSSSFQVLADPIEEEGLRDEALFDDDAQDRLFLHAAGLRLEDVPENPECHMPVKHTFIHYDMGASPCSSGWQTPKRKLRSSSAPAVLSRPKSAKKTDSEKMEVHLRGDCLPCAYFFAKKDGCRMGDECTFCHLCPADEIVRRKKEKRSQLRANRYKHNGGRDGRFRSFSAAGAGRNNFRR
eukprot:TRINITY_DN22367_c0_g1_i1.p2 TRINITY_DN22367_c0_g1~~TRINITY_DN22367_c0_g1_i1.p2  ORF type:complete len:371 (-),score=56.07 TRINITY_DN22367_c0_g1_i1:306-1418(-)